MLNYLENRRILVITVNALLLIHSQSVQLTLVRLFCSKTWNNIEKDKRDTLLLSLSSFYINRRT